MPISKLFNGGSVADEKDEFPQDYDETFSATDLIDEIEPDPRPGTPLSGRWAAPTEKVTPTKAVKQEVSDQLQILLDFFTLAWTQRDPYCGGVMAEQSPVIVDRMVTIIMRRPSWLAWFNKSGGWADWLALATAVRPVIDAIYAHHITKVAGNDGSNGEAYSDYPAYRPS